MTNRASGAACLEFVQFPGDALAQGDEIMRAFLLGLLLAFGLSAPALAQTRLTLQANPVPIIEATINGQPVRLEVDPRLPRFLAVSTATAERLGLRRIPFAGANVGIDGSGALLRGRTARPHVTFGERELRVTTGIFPAPITSNADGVIGAAALPYDVITIELGGGGAERAIEAELATDDVWILSGNVGGLDLLIDFDLGARESVFSRTASTRFDDTGAIVANGALEERPVIFGLRTLMQPVRTELSVLGLPLGATFARTNAPLLGAIEEDAIIVEAESGRVRPPRVSIGRDALSQCASISVDRRTQRMILRCA